MIKTEYKIDGKEVSYEILEDGYKIYLGEKPWISQRGAYIPYPDLSYEEGCLKQIEEIYNGFANAQEEIKTKEDKITELENKVQMLTDCVIEMSETIYV